MVPYTDDVQALLERQALEKVEARKRERDRVILANVIVQKRGVKTAPKGSRHGHLVKDIQSSLMKTNTTCDVPFKSTTDFT